MIGTKEECENAARILGLADTSASTSEWNNNDCNGQQYLRCSFWNGDGTLNWNPACGDNVQLENHQNICTEVPGE